MKYKGPPVAAIFFMTSFNRDRGGGHGPPGPPPGSAAVLSYIQIDMASLPVIPIMPKEKKLDPVNFT